MLSLWSRMLLSFLLQTTSLGGNALFTLGLALIYHDILLPTAAIIRSCGLRVLPQPLGNMKSMRYRYMKANNASKMAEIRRKLVIVGDGACGKTCLLM